jgi:hypothetical protein
MIGPAPVMSIGLTTAGYMAYRQYMLRSVGYKEGGVTYCLCVCVGCNKQKLLKLYVFGWLSTSSVLK